MAKNKQKPKAAKKTKPSVAKNQQKPKAAKKTNPAGQNKKTAGQRKPPTKAPKAPQVKSPQQSAAKAPKAPKVKSQQQSAAKAPKVQNVKSPQQSAAKVSAAKVPKSGVKTNFNIQARSAIPGTSKNTAQAKKIAPKRKLDQPKQEIRYDNRPIHINVVNPAPANPMPYYPVMHFSPSNHQQIINPGSSRGFQTPNTHPIPGEVKPINLKEETRTEEKRIAHEMNSVEQRPPKKKPKVDPELTPKQRLLKILEDLKQKKFKQFKTTLNDAKFLEKQGYDAIPTSELEDKDEIDVMDRMCSHYTQEKVLHVAYIILEEINEKEHSMSLMPYVGERSN